MLQQLGIITIASALIASLVVTALSWPSITKAPSAATTPGLNVLTSNTPVPMLWLASLLFALTAIGIATNQAILLCRLSAYQDGLARIRILLNNGRGSHNNHRVVEPQQIWLWQVPAAFLNGSIYLFIAGLGALAWDIGCLGQPITASSNPTFVAAFVVTLTICAGSYLMGSAGLYRILRNN